ncbi:hypothetical protein ACLOJK_034616 [Asimina triloba]
MYQKGLQRYKRRRDSGLKGAVFSKMSSPSTLCCPFEQEEKIEQEEEMAVSIFSLSLVQGTCCFKLHLLLPPAYSLSLPLAQGSVPPLPSLSSQDPLLLPDPLLLLPDPLLLSKTHRPPSIVISLLPAPNKPIDFPSSSSRSSSQCRAFTLDLYLSISLCLNVSFLSNLILLCPNFAVCQFLTLPISASSVSHPVDFDHPFTTNHTQQSQCTTTGYLNSLSVASPPTTMTLFSASRTFS